MATDCSVWRILRLLLSSGRAGRRVKQRRRLFSFGFLGFFIRESASRYRVIFSSPDSPYRKHARYTGSRPAFHEITGMGIMPGQTRPGNLLHFAQSHGKKEVAPEPGAIEFLNQRFIQPTPAGVTQSAGFFTPFSQFVHSLIPPATTLTTGPIGGTNTPPHHVSTEVCLPRSTTQRTPQPRRKAAQARKCPQIKR